MQFRNFGVLGLVTVGTVAFACSSGDRDFGDGQGAAAGIGTGEGGDGASGESSTQGGSRAVGGEVSKAGEGNGAEPAAGSGGAGTEPPLCEPDAEPARLLAPLSSSLATNRRPTLTWELGDDCGPLTVELCEDRACEAVITTISVAADAKTAKPKSNLPPGAVFWRLKGSGVASAVWQVNVSIGAPVDSSWGTLPDFNGDGFGDTAVGSNNGGVYVYYGSAAGLGDDPTPLSVAGGAAYVFGSHLASAGDVNGDGFTDLLVGAAKSPAGGSGSRLHVFAGGAEGVAAEPFATLDVSGLVYDSNLQAPGGSALRGGADINQDGYSDFVMTAPTQGATSGTAQVFYGSATGITSGPTISIKEVGPGMAFCDADGDRVPDLLLGATGRKDSQDEDANTLLFKGNGQGFELPFSLPALEGYGVTVACGDYAGDGYPDVVSSYPQSGARGYNYGDVLLFEGAGSSFSSDGQFLPNLGKESYAWSGQYMATIGDMNGDGRHELGIGLQQGEIHVLFATGSATPADTKRLGGPATALTSADVNGDGLVDLITGAPEAGITVFYGDAASGVIYPSTTKIAGPTGAKDFGVRLASSL